MMSDIFTSNHTKITSFDGIEMVVRPKASAVLAMDEDMNVLMVEQDRGCFGKILEVPAGKVDDDETPLKAAERELREETGYKSNNMIELISYNPSVGYTTEEIHCFFTDEITLEGEQRLDDNERIGIRWIPFNTIMDMIKRGEIKDSKTIICVFWFNMTYIR